MKIKIRFGKCLTLEFVLRLDLEGVLLEKDVSMNKMYGLQKIYYFALPIKYARHVFMKISFTCMNL